MEVLKTIKRIILLQIDKVCGALNPVKTARRKGAKIGSDCRLFGVRFFSEPYLVTLGDHVSATQVDFITHDGGVWVFRGKNSDIDLIAPIKVGNNVFLGMGCKILPGVTIGDNVVIGAGAVVTKNIPSNCVAVGVPAKPIKSLEAYWDSKQNMLTNTKGMSELEKKVYLLKHLQK